MSNETKAKNNVSPYLLENFKCVDPGMWCNPDT